MKNENLQKSLKDNIYNIFSDEDLVASSERMICLLLSDHPEYIKGIKRIRKIMNIPTDGFSEPKLAFDWEHAKRENKNLLVKEVERLLNTFVINKNFLRNVKNFTYNFVCYPKRVGYLISPILESEENLSSSKKIGTRIILADENIEIAKYQFLPGAIYLEILSNTTLRDIQGAWKKINKLKGESSYNISKANIINRELWFAYKTGKSTNEIRGYLKDVFNIELDNEKILLYKHRYKNALQKLRKF